MPFCRWSFASGSSAASIFTLPKGPLVPRRPFFALLRMPFCRWSFASGSSAARIFMLAKGPLVPPDPSFLCLLAAGHVPAEAPNDFLPLVVCQRKLHSLHFHAARGPLSSPQTLLCAAPNAFLPLVVCQRKLRSSHFHPAIGPFSPPRPFFALLRMPIGRRSCASGSSAARIFMLAKGPVVSSDPFFFSSNAY